VSDAHRTKEPISRLTRLCAAMTDVLEAQEEYGEDVKCIVFLQDGDRGGLQMHGYEDENEAIADLFIHLKAIFASNGRTLTFMPMPGRG
jgi:hypothetical protein